VTLVKETSSDVPTWAYCAGERARRNVRTGVYGATGSLCLYISDVFYDKGCGLRQLGVSRWR